MPELRVAGKVREERFLRRLSALLRDPAGHFRQVVARELRDRNLTASKSDRDVIFQLGVRFAFAFKRLLLVQGWGRFLAENSGLTLDRATRRYVGQLRRSGIRASRASLYRDYHLFKRAGIAGLCPRWKGGKDQIAESERALIKKIIAGRIPVCELYPAIRQRAGLLGPPVSASTVRRIEKDLRERDAVRDMQTAHRSFSQRKGKVGA